MKGCLYFHQGWTDIINSLPLINYYAKRYEKLMVVLRLDSMEIVDYYLKEFTKGENWHVLPVYVDKRTLDAGPISVDDKSVDLLFHGYHDRFRREGDKFKNKFGSTDMYFARGFYEFYDIPFIEKVNNFTLKRDNALEESKYQEFISKYGEDYILYHDDQNTPGGNTGINLTELLKNNNNSVNLNGITNNVFSYIKILENAKELHLVDSIWAATCYLLDSKYAIFKNNGIKVYLYAFKSRGGGLMEKYEDSEIFPIHPENWIIKKI
jgi:hypothetical protein